MPAGLGSCIICLRLFREACTNGECYGGVTDSPELPGSLQGKVHKSFRKSVAGVCLLLAAKFILDLKKQEISDLINVS